MRIAQGLCAQQVGVLEKHQATVDALVPLMKQVRDFSVLCGSASKFALWLKNGEHNDTIHDLHTALHDLMTGTQFLQLFKDDSTEMTSHVWASESSMKVMLDHWFAPHMEEIRKSRSPSVADLSGLFSKEVSAKCHERSVAEKIDAELKRARKERKEIKEDIAALRVAQTHEQSAQLAAQHAEEIARKVILLKEKQEEIDRLQAKLDAKRDTVNKLQHVSRSRVLFFPRISPVWWRSK